MSITVLSYMDQALVNQINAQALERAEAKKAAETAPLSTESNFSSALNEASQSYNTTDAAVSATVCPEDLNSIFEEAASTYGVSAKLLTSIARAESNFNPNAVSSAGAIGIMQLMPATAVSLGVTNSYDPRENIMGGAKLISQLLTKYSGNVSLALAAYNAGSSNVDAYGGIPPFTETQNYVKKVLAYMNADFTTTASSTEDTSSSLTETVTDLLTSGNLSKDALNLLASLLKLASSESSESTEKESLAAVSAPRSITARVVDSSRIVEDLKSLSTDTENTPVNTEEAEDSTADSKNAALITADAVRRSSSENESDTDTAFVADDLSTDTPVSTGTV